MKLITVFFYLLISLAGANVLAAAAVDAGCEADLAADFAVEGDSSGRRELIRLAAREKLPAFLKDTIHGPLPVILVTRESLGHLRNLVGRSFGAQILLQPNTIFGDHGILRLGDWQIDWGPPGNRGYFRGDPAEIHDSGIAWRSLSYRVRENSSLRSFSRVTVEVLYKVTSPQRKAMEYYHRIRRATLFGIEQWNGRGQVRPEVPLLLSTGESCFDFCMSNHLETVETALVKRLGDLGWTVTPARLQEPTVRRLLKQMREIVMKADLTDPKIINHELLVRQIELRKLARQIFTPVGDRSQLEDFINALAGYDAVVGARKVVRELEWTADPAPKANFANPKATAILVYDSAEQAPRFRDATYSTPGYYPNTGWGQDPYGTIPFADQYPLR